MTNMAASPEHPNILGARKPQVYGGVCVSVDCAAKSFQGNPAPSPYRGLIFRTLEGISGLGIILIDAPLSLVGDTLTLPFVLYAAPLERGQNPPPSDGVTPTAAGKPASP